MSSYLPPYLSFFFFNDTATTEIYTLSLHDALPISVRRGQQQRADPPGRGHYDNDDSGARDHQHHHHLDPADPRSEEHTSELQSRSDLVCRLLLEKKKNFQGIQCATPALLSPASTAS